MQLIFLENKKGSHNGLDIIEHKKGDLVKEEDLSEYLKEAWLEQGVIEEIEDCNEDCDNCDEIDCLRNPNYEEDNEDDEDEEDEETDEDDEEDDIDNEGDGTPENPDENTEIIGGVKLPVEDETEGEGDAENLDETGEDENTSTDENNEDAPQDEETDENGEDAGEDNEEDENPLVIEAKEILASETPDTERLKEIGIALDVENIEKCSNPDTIIKKVQNAIDDLAEEGEAE